MMRGALAGLAAAASLVWLLPALPAAASAEPRVHQIVMANMHFGPAPAGIKAGDTIVWVNRDLVPHTATAQGAFDVEIPARQSRRMRVTRPGAFSFYCRFHPTMRSAFTATR